jgi:hypothetical protein
VVAGRRARPGCARIGSPGIFRVQTAEALCEWAYPQMGDKRP